MRRSPASTALTFITSANTYMQLHTDAGVRGRVMALYMMIFMGGTPIGAPVIGWIGHEYGARWTLLGGGLLTITGVAVSAAVFLRLERARRERGPVRSRNRPSRRLLRHFDPVVAPE